MCATVADDNGGGTVSEGAIIAPSIYRGTRLRFCGAQCLASRGLGALDCELSGVNDLRIVGNAEAVQKRGSGT
jgi:hypothetical protein